MSPTSRGDSPATRPAGAPAPRRRWWASWWLWWAAALIVWNVVAALRSRPEPRLGIPYSAFLDQLQADNVATAYTYGTDIEGALKAPITWPPEGQGQQTSLQYATRVPLNGDPNLLPQLRANKVVIVGMEPRGNGLLLTLAINFLPWIGLGALIWYMGRRAAAGQEGIFGFGKSRARLVSAETPSVTFADVAGVDESKQELQEIIDFLRDPERFYKLGAKIPRGVLLVGPPGTGKTLLARAVAGEAGVPFFNMSGSEFVEMLVGVGASRVRDLFAKAREKHPSIVFIDELDAVGRQRGVGLGGGNDEREQTLNQLLIEMDGFDDRQAVVVLAATNRPDVLDSALLRPGRFDRRVTVPLPDRSGREAILGIHTRHIPLAPDVSLANLAAATPGMSGADLANLANEAALHAAESGEAQVTMHDFEVALDKVLLGRERRMLMSPEERTLVAYHESGHALVALLTPGSDPVRKVTIVPHGPALGVTQQLPEMDRASYPEPYLLGRIAVALGGRAAEQVAVGAVTTGAENDLEQATRIARQMVARWGMSKAVGLVALGTDQEHPFLGRQLATEREFSEETAALIDREVRRIIEEQYESVERLLRQRRHLLDRLAQALLAHDTLLRPEIDALLADERAAAS